MKLNMINGNTVGTSSKQSEDSQLKPNYLSTFDYIVKEKKQKQVELSQKQAKKSYLQGFKWIIATKNTENIYMSQFDDWYAQ